MDIEISSQEQIRLIKLRGKLSLGDPVDRLRDAFNDLIDRGERRFLLDLGEVPMIDSSGIGLLVRSLTTVKQRGGSLKLLNPSKISLQTLKMIGLANLFEIFEDQTQALASFG